jgi:hypothetical protein
VLTIPDHAQGAAIGGRGLWIGRGDWNWGTLDRLDPVTGAPQRRYEIEPGTEGLAFGNTGRLWAVSEAGSRHIYDHPFLGLFQPFFPLVFALDLSRFSTSLAWSELDYVPPLAAGWDRGFESGSLQRGVYCELAFGRTCRKEASRSTRSRAFMPKLPASETTDPNRAHIGMDLFGPAPDFAGLARSMGWWAEGPIENADDQQPALQRAVAQVKTGKPALVDAVTQHR